MADLIVSPSTADAAADGTLLSVTPESAGWAYVGFEAARLAAGAGLTRRTGKRELCVVIVSGTVTVQSAHGTWTGLGGRSEPWDGAPDAAYLGPRTAVAVHAESDAEIGLCWAPAPGGGAAPRVLPGAELAVETRGYGALERRVSPILMGDRDAESLLVCEVVTPSGHWSSYPPHKHDRDAPPAETVLEETYYHRMRPDRGFALQRVYTDDRSLDETMVVGNRDCVLVARGYHTVSAAPGYDNYYLNVMAGPHREWAVATDPDHAWTLEAGAVT